MNSAYRLIWNDRLGAWCVAPEIASARGKRSGGVKRCASMLLLTLAFGTHATLAADLAATALPGGGQITAGQAVISTSGANMAINQSSQRAIINWQNFDIGSQASVNFQQPNSSAVTLNRAGGATASRIEGQLTANGQVFLINPNGVLFGSGARVNVGGLAASTLNIRDDDFLSGNYSFSGNGGSIDNRGQIAAAPGGYLAFIAPSITNSGTISAPQGTVAMAAGERVRLNFAGDRLVSLDVASETLDTLIANKGAIRAEGGAILLTAAGAEAVTRGVINNTGVIEAGSLTQDGGRIVLTAADDVNLGAGSTVAVDGKKGGEITVQAKAGTMLTDGQLSARGASGTGGTIKLLGNQVGLINAVQVDASGATGGGSVLVGGDYQGGNAEVANARATYIAPDVTIKANALQRGDGGKVIVWADEIARFYGNVSADGAGTGGNGGFVETSGKAVLDASGSVSALGAGGGRAGSWLVDPYDITIQTTGSNTNVTASPNFTSNGNSAIVTTGSIQTALNGGTSVTVATGAGGAQAGNITVANAINKSAGGNASLTLTAINNIVFNAGADIGASAGQLALTLNAGGTITNPATINTNGGLLTYNATGAATQSGVISGAGGLTKNGAGMLTLSGANAYTGTTTINAGTLTVSGGNAIADTSQVTLANTAGATLNLANSETIGNLSGGGATGGNVTLGANSLTVNEGGTTTYSGVISGTGGLTKAGTGTLTLSRANSYSGSTTINAGTLALGASNVLANGSSVVVNGGTLNIGTQSDTVAGVQLLSGAITGTTGTLTSTLAYDLQSGTVSARLGGTADLNKTTAGTVTLSGANTYTGATNINAGTLALGAANRIADMSAVTVASGATFNLANFAETVGSLAGTGNVTLGTATLTAGGNNTSTTFSGVASGTGGLTKAGTGALTLSGANTYTGTTTISAGTLTAAGGSAIADTSQVTLANTAGATLNLANSETIGNLSGGGATGGNVTLGANTLTLNEAGVTTYSGVVSGSGGLTKTGAGTLTLGGINTYTGATGINAGTLALNATGTISASSGVVNTGNFSIAAAKTIDSMTGTGTTALGANTLTIGDASNTSSSYTGVINGTGGLVKAGTGILTLGGANTYTGTTTINAGTLRYGANNAIASGAVVVNNGGTYDLNNFSDTIGALTVNSGTTGGTVTTGTGTLTLGGNVTSSGGAANATISGNLALGGATRTFTTTNAADGLEISAAVSGAVGLTKAGAGTLTLSGNNSYSGTTTINAGTLTAAGGSAIADTSQVTLANTAGATLNLANSETIGNLSGGGATGGNVTLGANTLTVNEAGTTTYGGIISGTGGLTKAGAGTMTLSGANTYTGATNISVGTLTLGNNERIADSSAVIVASGATFNLGNYGETFGSLAGAGTVTKSGTTARTLAVGGDNASTTFSGVIQQTGTGALSLTKNGNGTLALSGANTYTGVTTINAGTLVAANNTALGTLAGGTTVANGATLALQGGITVGAEALSINGTGVGGDGALRNLGGNNTLGGTVTLAGNAEIQSDGGTLTLNAANSVTGATRNLTIDGAGNTTINGTITTTSGTLTKNGTGTLTLSGNNTYTGATAVNAGTVAVTANNALGTTANGTTVASGATLDFRNVVYATTEAVTLNGGTLATSTGTSSFVGGVTLNAPSSISVGGTQLTLSGAVSAPSSTLTVTGSGSLTATNATNDFSTVAVTSAANVSLRDANAINLDTSTISGDLALTANGVITQSGAVSVAGTTTLAAGAAYSITLNNAGNDFGTVAITSGNNVTLVDSNPLTLGATSATGLIDVRTRTGDLTAAGNISTLNTAANAIVLVAGETAVAGTATGGNIIIGGGAAVSTGSGGRATLYSGSVSGSVGITALVGSGSGNFRYNSDEVTTNYSAPLGAGTYAIYREQPTLSITADSPSAITYGSALPALTATVAGLQNGDTLAQAFSTQATVTAGGATSTSGNLVAGNHTLTPAGAVEKLGYALSYATGILVVDKLALTGASIAGVSTTYGTPAATGAVSFTNIVGSDVVTSTASLVSPTYSTSNNLNAGSYAQSASGLSGADANNYSFVGGYTTATNNYTVDKLALTGASIAGVSTTYGTPAATGAVSFTNIVGSDVVTSTASLVSPTYSTSNNLNAGSYAQSASGLSGADANNYSFVGGYTTATNNYTVDKLVLTGSILAGDKIYDSTTAATISSRSLSGVIVGDSVSYVGGIANFSDKNVGIAKTVTGSGLGLGGVDAGNYTVNSVASTTASITPALLTLNAVSDTKVYDGTTVSGGVVGTVGVQGSDSVGDLSQSYASKNVLGNNASTLAVNGGYIVNDGNGGANYSVMTASAQGTISPVPLTIAANDASKSFGTPNPTFTATYTGFVGGETPSVLNGALSFQTVAGTTSPPGNYVITPYGQSSSNYAIVFRDGVLTINGVPADSGGLGAGADQQAIGAQYTSQGAPSLALVKIRFIQADEKCKEATATSASACSDQLAGISVVRLVNGGMLMPGQ